ncbi:MAG: hypothetical protein HN600_15180 [Bacteroidetes bacterium]|jgi:hypothetical protein|nr:hypothetical protein [Bacteroidota bacterium]
MNRGRIQAQGNNTEKSAPWAIQNNHTKNMGIERVDNLSNQLTPAELNLRTNSLQDARNRINTAPSYGIAAVMKKSYYDDFRNRQIRIDIEVNAGIAFIDEPQPNGD